MRRGWLVSSPSRLRSAVRWTNSAVLILGCSLASAVASAAQTHLDVLPKILEFEATQGTTNPKPQSLSIRSNGTPVQWRATTDALWLEVDPREGTSTEGLTVSVNIRNVTAGIHPATITIAPIHAQSKPETISVILKLKHHPVLRTYSVIELAKQHGSLTGILAGFALTVAILLFERHERGKTPKQVAQFARSSIVSFFVAFATSLETAFNFVVIGAETEDTVRLAVQLIPVVFGLAICILYLFLGIALALFEYHIAEQEHMPVFTGLFCFVALGFLGANIAFSTLWSVAVWEGRTVGELTAQNPWYSYSLIISATFLPASIIAGRIYKVREESSTRRTRRYIPLATTSLVVVTVTSVLASFIADAVPPWMQDNMRLVGFITVLLYIVISGGAAVSLPCYERRPPPSTPIGAP